MGRKTASRTTSMKYFNGEVWAFENPDNEGVTGVVLGKRFIMKFAPQSGDENSQNGSAQHNNSNKTNTTTGSKSLIKITGHKADGGALNAHLKYITRDGELELHDNEGNIIKDKEQGSTKEWINRHIERGETKSEKYNARISTAIVFSAPEGTNAQDFLEVVKDFAEEAYSEHNYLMVLHDEKTEPNEKKKTKHPHVHLIIERMSKDRNVALKTNQKELANWRKSFSHFAQDRGIELSYKRESANKTVDSQKNMNVYQMLKTDKTPAHYSIYNDIANKRVARNDVKPTKKEQLIIGKAINKYIENRKEIADIESLIASTTNTKKIKEYKKELKYISYMNSTQRMPISKSQMFLKYAIHENTLKIENSLRGNTPDSKKFSLVAPTIKHYMYANKLAQNHGVELPVNSNLDTNVLTQFIGKYGDKPTKQFIEYINKVAKDRNLKIEDGVLSSHRDSMKWMKDNKSEPTLKSLDYANRLAISFNVALPKELNNKSLKGFIQEYGNKPSDKMINYAIFLNGNGTDPVLAKILNDRQSLSEFITEKLNNTKENTKDLNKLKEYSVDESELKDYQYNGAEDKASPKRTNALLLNIINKENIIITKEDIKTESSKQNIIESYAKAKDVSQFRNIYFKLNDIKEPKIKEISKSKPNRGLDDDYGR